MVGEGHVVAPQDLAGIAWRRRLALRATDRAVHRATGLTPLSVSTDRIGLTAIRAAGILAALAACGRSVERDGTGCVAEVYPAASLWCWGLPHRRYKGADKRSLRAELLDGLGRAAPWLDVGDVQEVCLASDDALDALIAAFAARAVTLGAATRPSAEEAEPARREGWIALPTCPLEALADGPIPGWGALTRG